ncbi:MAG: hypothetical protein ACREID_03990 [Planctomycetota bacterium]
MGRRIRALAALLSAACSTPSLPHPDQTDEALVEGRVLDLPVDGDFPRLGLQWTYRVEHSGWPEDAELPPRIAYRLTSRHDMGHPWAGWWCYGAGRGMEKTGATMEPDDVYWHPPRIFAFAALEWAPWPVATPGSATLKRSTLVLGEGWTGREGERIEKISHDIGPRPVDTPAGRFEAVWHVEGKSPGWTGRFWWLERGGFVKMQFLADDGRKLELSLEAQRQVDARPGRR